MFSRLFRPGQFGSLFFCFRHLNRAAVAVADTDLRLQHDRPVALAECSGETEAKLLYVATGLVPPPGAFGQWLLMSLVGKVLARRDLLAAEVRGQVDVIGHPEIEVILSLQELRELTGADPLPEDLSVLRLRMLACPKFLNKQGLNLVLGRRGQRDARAVKRVSSRLNSVDARASAALQTARPPCSSLCCGFARLFDDRETSTQAPARMFVQDIERLVKQSGQGFRLESLGIRFRV